MDLLDRYAETIIGVGVNLQVGQRLQIRGSHIYGSGGVSIDFAPFVRRLVRAAYAKGARLVDVVWEDNETLRTRLTLADPATFETSFETWRVDALVEYAHAGDALLSLTGHDPAELDGIDPAITLAYSSAVRRHSSRMVEAITGNHTNWCVVGVPNAGWAAKMMPDTPHAYQEARLWETVLASCRVRPDSDPIAEWQAHIKALAARKAYLNHKAYDSLHYTGPGTDLTIGLPEGHIWSGGTLLAGNGVTFTPNLPTEEIFTLPHRERAEGTVQATKPLAYSGGMIEDFALTFKDGRVVNATAKVGQNLLDAVLNTDDNARRLGEVALVPHSSPISQSGLLFYSILYDENASCHIALGAGYKFTLEGAQGMNAEQFAAVGGNTSALHLDFMIGNGELDIDGLTATGLREPVMRQGEWAFDV